MPQMQMLDLELLINSRYPFIADTTEEEDRLQDMLRRLAVRLDIPFYVWASRSVIDISSPRATDPVTNS